MTWTESLEQGLRRYAAWLRDEAIPGGGLGPAEAPRIWRRHLADSLLFAAGWRRSSSPQTLIDLGSGVGLPGIPLALAWPDCAVTLVDRSRRRVELARRAARVVGVGNVTAVVADARRHRGGAEMVTVRAVLPPPAAVAVGRRLVAGEGVVVVALSHGGGDPVIEPIPGVETIEVPASVLDSAVVLLRMAVRG